MKAVLVGLSLALGMLLAMQWHSWAPNAALPPPPTPQPAAAGDGGQAADPLDPFALEPPPKSEYASVVERPLFLPERRPPPDEPEEETVAEEEPMAELDGVDLTAVVITPAVVSAWVREPQSKEVKRLRLGDDYLGWTVKTIEPARLVLERQGETDELPLRDYTNAPTPIPPTRLPPRRAGGDRSGQPDQARAPEGQRAAEGAEPPEQRRRAVRRPVRQTRGRGSDSDPAPESPKRAPTP